MSKSEKTSGINDFLAGEMNKSNSSNNATTSYNNNDNNSNSGSGGGGMRELGTVTGGMALRSFDSQTRPYTRQDFVHFLQNGSKSLNEQEWKLIYKGVLVSALSWPLSFYLGWKLSNRFRWIEIARVMLSGGKTSLQAPITRSERRIRFFGRLTCGVCAFSIAYVLTQQWFVNSVLDLDEKTSDLSFHLRRLMLSQRSGLMFTRTATREVTREEQLRLMQRAQDQVNENRSGERIKSGMSTGPTDVNLQLGAQVLTPIAQSGYKPMTPK